MSIRPATTNDLPDLVRLNDQIQLQHVEQYPSEFKYPVEPHLVSEFFAMLVSSTSNEVIVAFDDENVLGYLWYETQEKAESPFKHAKLRFYIHHVCVDSRVRRGGVASALFDRVEQEARIASIAEIALDTWSMNKEGQDFFARQGFERIRLIYSKKLV